MTQDENRTDWPYEHRPIADQGASEARYDGQGALVAGPEGQRPVSDYERLREALYDQAMNDDYRVTYVLAELFDDMLFHDLAHSIREGVRDSEKRRERERLEALADYADRRASIDGGLSAGFWENMKRKLLIDDSVFKNAFLGADMARERDRTAYYAWPCKEAKTLTATQVRESLGRGKDYKCICCGAGEGMMHSDECPGRLSEEPQPQ